MNPDRNTGGMTVNAMLQVGLVASAIIPAIVVALLGFYASQRFTNNSDATTLLLVVAACVIVVLLGVLAVNYFVQRRIKDRLLALVDVYRDYAAGNRSARAVVNGDDEFAMLSMSLNTLLEGQSSGQGGVNFGTIGNDAAALQAQIEKLLQEVSAVGDGDLRVQAEVTPDTLGVLADSFNYMIEELAKVVGRVQNTAVQVTNATRRILDRSAELAQASETQVAQISQTTEAVEALAIFIQNVARNAQLSAEAAQEALRNANSGQHSVRQTIDGMMLIRENVQETSKKIKRLGERSNEIGEIVRIIEDIADQTNLLALNAAIQSAMAGEHGRGFAVVADEIRLLAERSTESTKRIDTLVKSIQGDTYEAVVAMEDSTQEVVKGSQLADEAGRALNSIYSAVERQAQMIENIARAANEQTSVSEAVAVAMGQISEITRQTNAGTQEASASVSYLAELADQLRASVSTFRLPDQGNDTLSAFSGMASVAELPSASGNQFESDWGHTFAGNFPPLPEPNNSGSLVALSSRSGQSPFQHQDFAGQPFGSQQGFGGHAPFSSQQGLSGQQPFGSQQGFGSQQSIGGQQSFGSHPGFSGQFDFGNQQGFDEPNNFDFNVQQTFGNQGQSAFPVPVSQPLNSPQQQERFRQRWQGNPQQNQNPNAHPNQSQFGQDQVPFSNTGPFGS